jgi:PadR family transcriptional regulator PadR
MDLIGWQTQLRKGAAELVVLGLLSRGERYGLQVLEETGGAGGVLSEGSIYPLLNRLEREGKLVARWGFDEGAGNPRKYYRLSDEGARLLVQMRRAWAEFSIAITTIVGGEGHDHGTADGCGTLSGKSGAGAPRDAAE